MVKRCNRWNPDEAPQGFKGVAIAPGSASQSWVGTLRAHPKMALAALHRDATLLIYPGGAQDLFRPYSERYKIYFQGRHGFIKLALETETTFILSIRVHPVKSIR